MVTQESIEQQLKKVHFNHYGWGRTEARELRHIIMPDEEIYECVNGIYEGGFALLVATNFRVLLIDKKPLNYLTVEDLRFDMINEIDYSHRLLGAQIKIATGSKTLRFRSYNQPRLRKLITHVQHCMAETKNKQSQREQDQKTHLEQINQQLQAYLLAQHQQQQRIQEHLDKENRPPDNIQPIKPAPELSDYLYAQSLLARHEGNVPPQLKHITQKAADKIAPAEVRLPQSPIPMAAVRTADLYKEGVQEVFGKRAMRQAVGSNGLQASQINDGSQTPQTSHDDANGTGVTQVALYPLQLTTSAVQHALDLNPLRIAYSRLPLAMRNKRFGRPSFHAHSQAGPLSGSIAAVTPAASSTKSMPAHS